MVTAPSTCTPDSASVIIRNVDICHIIQGSDCCLTMPRLRKDSDSSEGPTNSLWVANLGVQVTESDLMSLFSKYGALDSIISVSPRPYAFVYFNRVDDAKLARNALQGTALRGCTIRIEFARSAKPSRSLWVGGISSSLSRQRVEEECRKYGGIEGFKYFRDRNSAFVDYVRLDDASQAVLNMNGKRVGVDIIRVDFLRAQPSRRLEHTSDIHHDRERQFSWLPQESMHHSLDPTQPGYRRQQHLGGRKGEGQPSKVLWVGYPPSIQIDEQMLHNAMILFGEIEKIKSFPSRHYSFVEFRSMEEARRAKEGLQGRLFNDPRITIMFSSSEFAPPKDGPSLHPGSKGPRPDIIGNRPGQSEIFNENLPIMQNNFSGSLPSGINSQNMLPRPSHIQGFPDIKDLPGPGVLGGQNWRRPSPPLPPPPAMLSPRMDIRPGIQTNPGTWDIPDAGGREYKRSRLDPNLPIDDVPYPLRSLGGETFVPADQPSLPGAIIQGRGHPPFEMGTIATPIQGRSDGDFIWRGVIAKGGTPVCHARCVPVGKGIESELPKIVNCSARTGLDMLAKHYTEAVGFDIVFFLPDSEVDFPSYTEFLHYLGAKERAGVAKLDDGTTLFLVPPSDFLEKVLNFAGPDRRLYGVVLKLPPQIPDRSLQHLPHHQVVPTPQPEYASLPKEDHGVQLGMKPPAFSAEPRVSPKLLPPTNAPPMVQAGTPVSNLSTNMAAGSQSGIALTPDLIATLASLLPKTIQPSNGSHLPASSSGMNPPYVTGNIPQFAAMDQSGHPVRQLRGNQYKSLFGTHPAASSVVAPSQALNVISTPLQDLSTQQIGGASSGPFPNYNNPVLPQINQQHQFEVMQNAQKGYGMAIGSETPGHSGPSILQNSRIPVAPNQIQGVHQQPPIAVAEHGNSGIPNRAQQHSSAPHGATVGDTDKNQRYQSTLQFAASLLLQLQQQQQQQQTPNNSQSLQWPGTQQ